MDYRKLRNHFVHFVLYTNFPPKDEKSHILNCIDEALPNTKNIFVSGQSNIGKTCCLDSLYTYERHWHIFIYEEEEKITHDSAKTIKRKFSGEDGYDMVIRQYSVYCPFSVFASVYRNDTHLLLKGNMFNDLTMLLKSPAGLSFPKRLPLIRKDKIVWELYQLPHKSKDEQRITKLLNGPHGYAVDSVLSAMEHACGRIDYTSHSTRFILEISPTDAQCYCAECTSMPDTASTAASSSQ